MEKVRRLMRSTAHEELNKCVSKYQSAGKQESFVLKEEIVHALDLVAAFFIRLSAKIPLA